MHFGKILVFLWLYVHMLLISICRSIWNVKHIYIYFQGWTYVLTLISHNNYWPSLQSYSLFFFLHYRQLLLAYFFPPHLHPHSDTLSFLISFWEVTGSGCRWAPGSSPGWRKHQSAGTAVPSHHYFSPYKKDFLLLWLTTATYWLPYTAQNARGLVMANNVKVRIILLEFDRFYELLALTLRGSRLWTR